MTEQDAFINAICTNPDDDTARLVYADWLDEHDQPERAEFIRVGCELATMPPEPRKLFVADGAGTMMDELGVGLVYEGDGHYSASSQERGLSTAEFALGERVDVYAEVAGRKKGGPHWMRGLKYVRHVTGKRELIIFRKDDQSGPWAGNILKTRSAELLNAHERTWRGGVLAQTEMMGHWLAYKISCTWTRGFVSGIECTLETFDAAAKAGLFACQPVTSVRLTDVAVFRDDVTEMDNPWTFGPLSDVIRLEKIKHWHPTEEACREYLSRELVAWARGLVDLPALTAEGVAS